MTRTLRRLAAVLALAAVPLGPIVWPSTPAKALGGCWIARSGTVVSAQCEYDTHQYKNIQVWVKCGTSAYWSKGNIIGYPNKSHDANGNQYHSTYNCYPWQPRVWTIAFWLW